MVLYEAKNEQGDSGAEYLTMGMLGLVPLNTEESFPYAGGNSGIADTCGIFPMPLFAFGDSDEDDEEDMDDDDYDVKEDEYLDEEEDDFDYEKDDFDEDDKDDFEDDEDDDYYEEDEEYLDDE